MNERAVFVFGFAKNDMGNISKDNLKVLKIVASALLELTDEGIQSLMEREELVEVFCNEKV